MKAFRKTIALLLALLLVSGVCLAEEPEADKSAPEEPAAEEPAAEESPVVVIRVAGCGDIYLELYPETAPATTANFLKLADSGFYNGLTFHRIISGFMVQGGDPNGNGTGGSGETIPGEFSANGFDNPLKHERGVISMARSGDMNGASSQFFIMHADKEHLDGNYSAFGRVLAGMYVVDSMAANAHVTDQNGTVPAEDQPVITEVARADREAALAAAEKEKENGQAGGTYRDASNGLSFPMPEGWQLADAGGGSAIFKDGTDTFTLQTLNYWNRLGKSGQERLEAQGLTREMVNTAAFNPVTFESIIGAEAGSLTRSEINGNLWYGRDDPVDGKTYYFRMAALNGTIILLTAQTEAGAQAVQAVLENIRAE